MRSRVLTNAIDAVGAIDWDRRLFDGLIPLPDGTSYNSYLVRGSRKTVLIDTVDPTQHDVLFENLRPVDAIDYVVAHHGEQDHSGSIPAVLEKYPKAQVVCSPKAKGILMDLLAVPEERFIMVGDGETLSLGNLTLEFLAEHERVVQRGRGWIQRFRIIAMALGDLAHEMMRMGRGGPHAMGDMGPRGGDGGMDRDGMGRGWRHGGEDDESDDE